jgi:O-antigen ligase
MITQGYDVYINSSSWLLGVDRTNLLHEVSERISPLVLGAPYVDIPNLHNEVMDTLATRGVIGLLAYFALYGGIAWLAFRPGSPDGRRSLLLMVLVAYLEFGLSNVQFEVGSLRLAFVILMLALLSRAR